MRRFAVFLFAVFLLATGLLAGTLTFNDSQSGLVIHYPKGWRVDTDTPTFAIENFPAAKRPPQLLVPAGKARIMVSAPEVKSVEELIERDRLSEKNGYTTRQTQVKTSEGSIAATEIRLDQNRVIPEGHTLIDVFVVRGRVYETYLLYRGAGEKAKYEKIYYQILGTVKFPH